MRKCGTRSKLTRDPQSLPTEIHILIHKPTIHPSMERKTQKELSIKEFKTLQEVLYISSTTQT